MKGIPRIEAVLKRAKSKDRDALGELYDAFVARVYRFVYFRVGKREDAEDLTEQVFVKVFTHIATYEDRGMPFEAWLFRIVRNIVTDYYRTRKMDVSLEKAREMEDSRPAPEDIVHEQLELDRIIQAIRQLPDQYEEILVLKFIEEYSTEEISTLLQKPASHVRVLQHRAIVKLRSMLDL